MKGIDEGATGREGEREREALTTLPRVVHPMTDPYCIPPPGGAEPAASWGPPPTYVGPGFLSLWHQDASSREVRE